MNNVMQEICEGARQAMIRQRNQRLRVDWEWLYAEYEAVRDIGGVELDAYGLFGTRRFDAFGDPRQVP